MSSVQIPAGGKLYNFYDESTVQPILHNKDKMVLAFFSDPQDIDSFYYEQYVKRLAAQYLSVVFIKIDGKSLKNIAKTWKVNEFPTSVLIEKGDPKGTIVGRREGDLLKLLGKKHEQK
ncbi:PREDICTED: thioredoxin H2-1-like [Nelumbo nucifera]|uniref:Thioredoxin domain-containing protein n=2 Tax=Nelumbo nucifera TaxID=4432 RepID=A0A822XTL1_NELNU|nr:PREDICTED: thioredoxin H2-1-like [Nelumbo nucifera]DAD22439.1 TPA_asm: hypothetical protein HUJ06_023902 [Nelumbo nucifera]